MARRKTTASTDSKKNYEVGYCKPPRHSQYRPGQSGYPAGRRKGVRNLKTDVKRTLAMKVKVKENGRMRTKSTQEAALMVLREKALNGNIRALNSILDFALRFNSDEADQAQPLSSEAREIVDAYVLARTTSATGVSADDSVPKAGSISRRKAGK